MARIDHIHKHDRTLDSVEVQIRDALREVTAVTPEIIIDGNIHRFPTGPRGTDDAGWYVFTEVMGIVYGSFGDWRTSETINFKQNIGRNITSQEKLAFRKAASEINKKKAELRNIEASHAAEKALDIWESSHIADSEHEYLELKGINTNGARIASNGKLVVPMYDKDNQIKSLQYIGPGSQKRYLKGSSTLGLHYVIGDVLSSDTIFIAEGFATSATIYEETGKPCVVAFSASNLPNVAVSIREKYKEKDITIVADNDKHGVGINYATQASAKIGAKVIVSPVDSDFNDYRASGGDVASMLLASDNYLSRFDVIHSSDIPDEYIAPDEIIEDLFVSSEMAVLYGSSNAGKTFLALSMARAVATGEKFLGMNTDKGQVLYLATESPASVQVRIQAMSKYYGRKIKGIHIVRQPVNLHMNPDSSNDIVQICKEIEKTTGEPVKMILADTLARISAGANENSGEDMAPIMDKFDDIAKKAGAALLVIHHSGKDITRGSRGWSGIFGAVDAEIHVEEDKGERKFSVTKQRQLSSKNNEYFFDLEIIEMGKNKWGKVSSTCVAIDFDSSKKTAKVIDFEYLFMRIWSAVGQDMIENKPYITKPAIKNYLMDKEGKTEATAKKDIQASQKERFIGCLINFGSIDACNNGFVGMDEDLINNCLSKKNLQKSMDKF